MEEKTLILPSFYLSIQQYLWVQEDLQIIDLFSFEKYLAIWIRERKNDEVMLNLSPQARFLLSILSEHLFLPLKRIMPFLPKFFRLFFSFRTVRRKIVSKYYCTFFFLFRLQFPAAAFHYSIEGRRKKAMENSWILWKMASSS